MDNFWLGFVIGYVISMIIGVIVEVLCIISGRGDIDTWMVEDTNCNKK